MSRVKRTKVSITAQQATLRAGHQRDMLRKGGEQAHRRLFNATRVFESTDTVAPTASAALLFIFYAIRSILFIDYGYWIL